MRYKVLWTPHATAQLNNAYNYIVRDSILNAEKVRRELLAASLKLSSHPERHPLDKDKANNNRNFRCFILHNYRVSYLVEGAEVVILRFRHTSMDSLKY